MNTNRLTVDHELWQRITTFSIDQPDSVFPFSKKLAKEENWTLDFTKKAIEEYKKFVYLCCVSPNGASPSETVDKVWHMHLIYTQNYWEEFCPNILKRKLHHHPSKGGEPEKMKHNGWFSDTLENYKEIFHQDAPEDIWKCYNKKPERKKFWVKSVGIFSLAFVLLILNSCSDATGFSTFITVICLIVGFLLFFGIIGSILDDNNASDISKKDRHNNDSGGGCGGGGSSCSGGSCGGGCGGGCGGCGGG